MKYYHYNYYYHRIHNERRIDNLYVLFLLYMVYTTIGMAQFTSIYLHYFATSISLSRILSVRLSQVKKMTRLSRVLKKHTALLTVVFLSIFYINAYMIIMHIHYGMYICYRVSAISFKVPRTVSRSYRESQVKYC